ncbi:transcriptional regulator [Microlunatus endophyticus]|uniref:Transcriptional regulator n=1 Tax=Microlunatus endophyticus TaxID=1716077 RepID=A0A917SFW6_9ACTN|nr:metalloregulator ArsR/SmtB family transcription factor [Microlunatus endophyticus]GGL76508.1 transcriptional regulator [Microlunatus endophyticus]
MTDPSAPDEVAVVFTALADPRRREVLETVASASGITATAVAERLTISRQAVAKHLAVLTEAGLVTSSKRGREVLFEVSPAPLEETARWLQRQASAWDRQLEALKRRAERSIR